MPGGDSDFWNGNAGNAGYGGQCKVIFGEKGRKDCKEADKAIGQRAEKSESSFSVCGEKLQLQTRDRF